MSLNFSLIASQIYSELIRALTGQLFTQEQISQITSHAIGKYFSEFFPEADRERDAKAKVELAKQHITEASSIINEMQADLDKQSDQLDLILNDIDEKKKLAEKYAHLASTNQEQFEVFKDEIGASLREELELQSEKGRTIRRIASITIWVVTLIAGAALGAYFKDILPYIQEIFA